MNIAPSLISSLIFGARTVNFVNSVGIDVIGKAVNVTTGSIGNLVSQFMHSKEEDAIDIQSTLESIDIEFKVSVLEELIKEQRGNAPVSVKKALLGVNDILVKIDGELKTIKEALDYHQTKYFKNWRTFDCSCNIKTIKNHCKILDERSKVFTDLLKIYNKSINSIKDETVEDLS